VTVTPRLGQDNGTQYIEIAFAPSLKFVTIVRRFVAVFFETVFGRPIATAHVALTAHELLENAVKCSRDGEAFIRIAVSGSGPMELVIETRNCAAEGDIEMLRGLFAELDGAQSPMEFYISRMERALDAPRSHLGLARVSAEAGMMLSHHIDGTMVHVVARKTVEGTP
jgi:hypothetical protein